MSPFSDRHLLSERMTTPINGFLIVSETLERCAISSPRVIITDAAYALANAIKIVFPLASLALSMAY